MGAFLLRVTAGDPRRGGPLARARRGAAGLADSARATWAFLADRDGP